MRTLALTVACSLAISSLSWSAPASADFRPPPPPRVEEKSPPLLGKHHASALQKFGIGAGGKFKGEASIAAVTVNTKTGEVLLDGKPVGDAAVEAAIAKACREAYGK